MPALTLSPPLGTRDYPEVIDRATRVGDDHGGDGDRRGRDGIRLGERSRGTRGAADRGRGGGAEHRPRRRRQLRGSSGGESLLSACFLLGLAGFATLLLAGFAAFLLLTYRAQAVSDPRLLYDLAFGLLAMSGAPTALALGSFALLARRVGEIPGWTAPLAVLGALAHLALFASFIVTDGFFSLQGGVIIAIPATLFAWILGTSVAMLAAARPRKPAGAADAWTRSAGTGVGGVRSSH